MTPRLVPQSPLLSLFRSRSVLSLPTVLRRSASLLGAAAVLLAILTSSVSAKAAEAVWTADWEAALKQASAEKKDILIDFTGSDWCGWCIKLQSEVFSKDEFKEKIVKNFVLVELDFPRRKELPEKTKEQNEMLSKKFGVQGFPTLFLTDALGRPYSQLGYMPGGPAAFLKKVSEQREVRVRRDDLFTKAKEAAGLAKAKLLHEGLGGLDSAIIHGFYGEIVDEILKLDEKDELAARATYEIGKLEIEVNKAMPDPAADLNPLFERVEKSIAKIGKSGESAQKLYWLRALICSRLDGEDLKRVEESLVLAVDAAPKSTQAVQLRQIIERVRAAKSE
jgi:thioredoxin-related protein